MSNNDIIFSISFILALLVFALTIIWLCRTIEKKLSQIKNDILFYISYICIFNLIYFSIYVWQIIKNGENIDYFYIILFGIPLNIFIIPYIARVRANTINFSYKEEKLNENIDKEGLNNQKDKDDTSSKTEKENEWYEYEAKGNIDDNEYRNFDEEQGGNTESVSEQNVFTNTQRNSEIQYNNQSELDEKSEKKDIKKIEFNTEQSVIIEKNVENVEEYKND